MKHYNMTHTTMKLCPTRENTADVVTTPSGELANVVTTTTARMQDVVNKVVEMPDVVNRTFLEMFAEEMTSPNDSAEEEPTSVMLFYRIGEALQAAEKTHESLTLKQKPPGFV